MLSDDLIAPEVIVVGGLKSRIDVNQRRSNQFSRQETSITSGFSFDNESHRHSYLSMQSSSHVALYQRDSYSISSTGGGSASRRGSSPSVSGQSSSQSSAQNDTKADVLRLKADRAQAKRELKEKNAALKALAKSGKQSPVSSQSDLVLKDSAELSFADVMRDGPASPAATPTKEQLKQDRLDLKAHAKALKEEEKLAKLKAAVDARNAKIDAHDLAVREKAAQKAAAKQAKMDAASRAWNVQARADSLRIWQPRDTETLLGKAHALQV